MATLTQAQALTPVATLERRRRRLLAQLDDVTDRRDRAITDARGAGVSLTAIADVLDVSRQALTRYLDRRETHRV